MSFPNTASNLLSSFSFGIAAKTSLKETGVVTLLGISIPMVLLPGIGACILTSLAAKARAISNLKSYLL